MGKHVPKIYPRSREALSVIPVCVTTQRYAAMKCFRNNNPSNPSTWNPDVESRRGNLLRGSAYTARGRCYKERRAIGKVLRASSRNVEKQLRTYFPVISSLCFSWSKGFLPFALILGRGLLDEDHWWSSLWSCFPFSSYCTFHRACCLSFSSLSQKRMYNRFTSRKHEEVKDIYCMFQDYIWYSLDFLKWNFTQK